MEQLTLFRKLFRPTSFKDGVMLNEVIRIHYVARDYWTLGGEISISVWSDTKL